MWKSSISITTSKIDEETWVIFPRKESANCKERSQETKENSRCFLRVSFGWHSITLPICAANFLPVQLLEVFPIPFLSECLQIFPTLLISLEIAMQRVGRLGVTNSGLTLDLGFHTLWFSLFLALLQPLKESENPNSKFSIIIVVDKPNKIQLEALFQSGNWLWMGQMSVIYTEAHQVQIL